MPRSGSTLIEQILASHSRVEGAGELSALTAIARDLVAGRPYPEFLTDLAPAAFAKLGAEYLTRTRPHRALGRSSFVDKFPGNVLHVGLLHLILPNARIIDIRRDPWACCVSLFKQSFASGQAYSYDLANLGRTYADYILLMQHFDAILPGRILHISYEALVADPESQTRRMLDHVGLPFEPDCRTFFKSKRAVRTPSSEQVRRPINRDGIDQWRHFEPWLEPFIRTLAPVARYVPDLS